MKQSTERIPSRRNKRAAWALAACISAVFALSMPQAWATVMEIEPNNPLAQPIPFSASPTVVDGSTTKGTAFFVPVTPELEGNNTFATAQGIATAGGVRISGSLAPGGSDVDYYDISVPNDGLSHSFVARIVSPPTMTTLDTVMGWFNSVGGTLATDDDGGFGTLSLIKGTVEPDYHIRLAVTGCCDFGFIGAHPEMGDYELDVGLYDNDVDFFRFTLASGTSFTGEITASVFDTVLGFYNSAGTQLGVDDNSGACLLCSRINGTVPGNNIVVLAVSGFSDTSFVGGVNQAGSYTLTLSGTAAPTSIPEPGTLLLLAAGLAGLVATRRLKKS